MPPQPKNYFIMDQEAIEMYRKVTLPYDQHGFTKSFDIEQFDPEEVRKFYQEFGVVVFDNVIEEDQAERTIDDLWTDIQTRCGKDHDRKDETTWKFQGWKGSFGFVNGQPLRYPQICKNRANPKVYKAFKVIYELSSGKALDQPLIAMFDRGSAMRPGYGHPQWVSSSLYHFDINPWWWTGVVKTTRKDWRGTNDYNPVQFAKWLSQGNKVPFIGYTKLAGVLALSDTNQTSGGFECVCGFQNWIKKWCETMPVNTDIREDEELMKLFQKVTQRKGSLLIFTRELPHNIYKNFSKNWRFAQYLRMSPLSTFMLTEFQIQKRKQCVRKFLPEGLEVDDPISQEIYMLK